jgi:hypothetical protein
VVADEWLAREAEHLGGELRTGGGLLPDLGILTGAEFDPTLLAPSVADFYQDTSGWRLEVWSQWSPFAWPVGWLLSATFARRLDQLSLPLRPLDAARGMDSRVRTVTDSAGRQLGAAWLRKLRGTGQTVYSGWYGTQRLPDRESDSVRVVFPLPHGSVSVFLRPENGEGGALRLVSPLGQFGDDGAYLVVADDSGEAGWARRVPLVEHFAVYVDEEGVLRTDHALDLWRLPVIRLHYRLDKVDGGHR